jgi:hypothetical protein
MKLFLCLRTNSPILVLKLGEVLLRTLHVLLHGFIPRLPTRRANFIRVRLHVLNSLQRSQRFIDGATERRVVDGRVLDDTFLVDDEQASQRGTVGLIVHVVRVNRLSLQVREQRVFDVAQAAFVSFGLNPRQVGVLGIDRAADDLAVQLRELFVSVAEGCDFSRADESEIQRVKEQDDVFLAFVLVQRDGLKLLVDDGFAFKVRRRVTDQSRVHRNASSRFQSGRFSVCL